MSEREGEGGRVEEEGGGRERGRFFYKCGYKKVYFRKIVCSLSPLKISTVRLKLAISYPEKLLALH